MKQYDESLEDNLTVSEAGSKKESTSDRKSRGSSEVFEIETDNDKRKEKATASKGTSEADGSEKGSTSSAGGKTRGTSHRFV